MFELSPSQEIVWLHEQIVPGSRAYNFTATIDLWGALDQDALRAGLARVLDRHAGLRLELVAASGEIPRQRVRERCTPRFSTVDLSQEPDPEAAFEDLLRVEAETPLDTHEAPLLRWRLARLGARHHRIVHVEHHLIHDGHSFAILLRDVFSAYRAHLLGQPAELTSPRSYEEHVRATAGRDRRASLAHWEGELRDATFDLPLPGLARPGAPRRHAGGQLRQTIGADLAERLREHSRDQGHTPFSTLLTLFAEVLRRHSGRADLVIGTAVGNRPQGFEETVGMFVNTIPLRLRLDPVSRASTAVDDVTDTLIRALPHQEVPVQELTRVLGLHTGGADNPLFSVMFSAHDAALPQIAVPELEISLYEGLNTGTTRFDLDLVLIPDDRRVVGERQGAAGMTLVWDYDRDLFGEETIRLLSRRFLEVLRAYVDTPGAQLSSLGAGSEAGARHEAASVACAAGRLRSVPAEAAAVLDAVARQDPARLAVVDGTEHLTYGQLDSLVDELADRLRAAGVSQGQPVAAVLPRGRYSVVTLLACLRIGAVYCPLSPDDPATRLEELLRRLAPALVLATRKSALALPTEGLPMALLDGRGFPAAEACERFEGAAYIIHTSGSTGLPKPVVVGRAALAHHARAAAERFGLTGQDRVLLFAQPSFDVALEEVLPSLLAGACLVLPQRGVPTASELIAVLAARRVTVANLPTSYLLAVRAELCEALADGRCAPRLLVLGGERVPVGALRALLDSTDATVLNAYGVTEAAITTTVHEVVREDLADGGEVPLGAELAGTRVHVLDTGRQPLPEGAVGELAISGAGLAEGYLGDEEATAARFVTVDALGGERVYLTGDVGFRDAAGRVCFLGRRDHQIKLRGYRIELEEIEAAASAGLGGQSCVVVLDTSAVGRPRLIGFLESHTEPDQLALHTDLSQRLPAALVPVRWVRLDALPTLAGGKPHRVALARMAAALPRSDQAPDAAEPAARFSDPAVALVAEGWSEVLGHDRFTPSSHFFQVGGHSLLAAQLAAWLEPRLGSRPPLRVLFQNPVLADQAHAVKEATA